MRRPSPSLVVSVVAVVLAAGGTSYAAVQLGKNSVRSKHIKNGQVKRSDIGRGAVDSRRIVNGTVAAEDLAPSAKIAGRQGPTGPAGPPGAAAPRADGPQDVNIVSPNPVPVTGTVSTTPNDERRFSRYQQALSANGLSPNCTAVTNIPAGRLLIETVHAQSIPALELYLLVPTSGGNAAPLQVPSTADATGEHTGTIETGLVIHDGATGLTAGQMYRSDANPLEMCVTDETPSGSFGSGWFLTGRVLP